MPEIMDEIEELESELEIAKHNLWVAKTHVEDRQDEVNKIETKLFRKRQEIKA